MTGASRAMERNGSAWAAFLLSTRGESSSTVNREGAYTAIPCTGRIRMHFAPFMSRPLTVGAKPLALFARAVRPQNLYNRAKSHMHEPLARTRQYKQLKLASRSEHAKSGTRKKDAYSQAERAAGYTQRDVQAMTRGSTCRK